MRPAQTGALLSEVRSEGDWAVNIEEGNEVGRDRGYRFTSYDGDVEWHPRPETAEGRDASGSDAGFHADLQGESPRPLIEACRSPG